MRHYKIPLLIAALIFGNSLFAQKEENKILSKFSFSLNYKESILKSKSEFKSQSRELFVGYKIFNSVIIGVDAGIQNEFNTKTNDFNYFNYYGLDLKYQYLFGKNLLNKKFVVEPYLSINNANSNINDDHFIFYDVGINLIYAKAPYFYFGSGVRQNFYSENTNTTVDWYYSFGLRF